MGYVKHEYININQYSRPGIKGSGVKGIVMHYTANAGGTARNHKNYFNNLKGTYASAHVFVDDVEALCIIPYNEVTYHANDTQRYNSDGSIYKPMYGKIGNANYSMIGIEMCLDKNGNITEKTFQNSVKAVKEIIKQYPHITRDMIVRHFDVTGKNCPASWVAKPSELERFKNAVFNDLEETTTGLEEDKTKNKKVGNVMILFRWPNSVRVQLMIANKYRHIENESDLKAVQSLMKINGYDTNIITDPVQIKYLTALATEIK